MKKRLEESSASLSRPFVFGVTRTLIMLCCVPYPTAQLERRTWRWATAATQAAQPVCARNALPTHLRPSAPVPAN